IISRPSRTASKSARKPGQVAISTDLWMRTASICAGTIRDPWARGITASIHFSCGFHIEIGDRYLPCLPLGKHPERPADNRIVADLASATVTKDPESRWVFFLQLTVELAAEPVALVRVLLAPLAACRLHPSAVQPPWPVRQEHWLSKEEPIREELPAEEWVEKWIGKT